jgi:hypothetical protein
MKNQKTIHDLYNQLGSTIADILTHKDCPTVVYNSLSNFMVSIDCKTPSEERQVAMARGTFVECLSILTYPSA